MAVTVAGFNIGTDAAVSISDQYGDIFPASSLGHIMEFDAESEDTEIKIVPLTGGGVPIYQTIWSGVRGHLMFTRNTGALTLMIIELMNAYHDSGIIPQFSMTLTVLNRDGTTDEYLFSGVQWIRPRFGNFRATKEVDERLEFRASRITATGGLSALLSELPTAA
jgi:hypothetical protein